jgi:hypothetical protein
MAARKYTIEKVSEKVTRYIIDADDEAEAEALVESGEAEIREEYEGDSSFRIVDITRPVEEPRDWTWTATVTITRHGTKAASGIAVEEALGEVCDEFDLDGDPS